MTAALPSYRLKIERAKRHIHELTQAIDAFWSRQPYVVVAQDNLATGKRHFKVSIREEIPSDWSSIVGDAVHNARASLDLMMVALVRHCDPNRTSYNHVHFVIRETKDEFEKALPRNTKGANPATRKLIEELKPYKGGDEAFWRLHQLDILDKHKALIPVGSAFQAFGITMDPKKSFPDAAWLKDAPAMTSFCRPAERQFPLKDGAHIASTTLNDPSKDDHQFAFEVAFGEGQILDGEPVIPALTQIVQFVEGVFDVIETGLPSFRN